MRVILNTVCSVALAMGMYGSAKSAGFEIIKPHRAVYEIKLINATDRSGIRKMRGRMVFEIRGNECDGITLKYRFLTNVSTARDQYLSDQQTSSYESADGKEFTFLSKSFLNEQLEETVKGRAVQTANGLSVVLDSPTHQEFDFPTAQFLTSYLVKLIKMAKAGEHFVRDDIYDGSDGGDETIATSSVISNLKSVSDSKDAFGTKVANQLDDLDAWHVSMSYFDKNTGATAEHTPVFESSYMLYDNGVSSDLVMRYPDYSLEGKLSELEMFEVSPCKSDG